MEKDFDTDKEKEIGLRLMIFRKSLPGRPKQAEFASFLGKTQAMYSLYETKGNIPKVVKEALSGKYGLNIDWLDTGVGDMFLSVNREYVRDALEGLNDENRLFVLEMINKLRELQAYSSTEDKD